MEFKIKNYQDKINGSKYFTWHEALYLPKTHAYALISDVEAANIMKLAILMDKIREHFNKPVTVHSWFRPPAYNKMIGGASGSYHLKGAAVDFSIDGVPIEEIKKVLYNNKSLWPYRGELDTTTWVHLDMGSGPWFNGFPKKQKGI